jgi:2-amino-4-hydroxy-6-hydroxymethyldihydropteridine diphosphokinase
VHSVLLSLGSNIHPTKNIPGALRLLNESIHIEAISSAWSTAPVGTPGPDFVNLIAKIVTELEHPELKRRILQPIENQLGRIRTLDKYAPRTIDIDVVLFDDRWIEQDLAHSIYLIPALAELIPDCIPPGESVSLREMAARAEVQEAAKKLLHFPVNLNWK